jgi:hypothetical protein
MNIRLEKRIEKLDLEPVVFRDYSREFDLIRRLHRLSVGTEAASMVMRPAQALARLLGRERLEKSLSAVDVLDEWASRTQWLACSLWKFRYGTASYQTNAVVRSLAKAGEVIGTLKSISGEFHYHDVFGIPVAPEPFVGPNIALAGPRAPTICAGPCSRRAAPLTSDHAGTISLTMRSVSSSRRACRLSCVRLTCSPGTWSSSRSGRASEP